MALENTFETIIASRKRFSMSPYCAFIMLYNTLSKQDQKSLDDAMAKNYPVNIIIQALRTDGHKCSADTLRLHRDGTCKCPKE